MKDRFAWRRPRGSFDRSGALHQGGVGEREKERGQSKRELGPLLEELESGRIDQEDDGQEDQDHPEWCCGGEFAMTGGPERK